MSINLFVGEVNTQTKAIKSYCNSVISGMTHVQTALSKIILEPSLKGNTYDSAKVYFQTAYLPATRGFILVCETAIRANQQFISDYKSNVDANSLQEDVLISQISRLDSMSSALDSIAIPKVFTQNIVDNLQNAKEKTAKKLDKLREFNHTSVSIFDDLEQQLQNLETGVTMIAEGKAWNGTTGTFSTTGLNMEWAQTIDQAWEARDKKNKKDKKQKMLNQLKNKNIQYTNDKNGKHWRINGEPVTDPEMIEFLNKNSDKLNSDDYYISELKIAKNIVLFGPGGFAGATNSISGGGFALRNLADVGKTLIGASFLQEQLNNMQASEIKEDRIAPEFEDEISKLTPNERIPKVKDKAAEVAEENGWERNKSLEKKNAGRIIYTDGKKNYSVDTQHGRFEVNNNRGKHQGEIDMDLKPTKKPDKSGGHDLNVK